MVLFPSHTDGEALGAEKASSGFVSEKESAYWYLTQSQLLLEIIVDALKEVVDGEGGRERRGHASEKILPRIWRNKEG